MFEYKKYDKLNYYDYRRIANYLKLKSLVKFTLKKMYNRESSQKKASYKEFRNANDLTGFIRALSEYDLNDDIYYAFMNGYETLHKSFNPYYDESCNMNAVINNSMSYGIMRKQALMKNSPCLFMFFIPNDRIARLDDAHAEIIINANLELTGSAISLSILADMCRMMNFNVNHNNMLVDVFINTNDNGKHDLYYVIDYNSYNKMLTYYGTDDNHDNDYGSDLEGLAANAVNNAGGIQNMLNSYDVFSCFHGVDEVLSFLLSHHRLVRLICGSFNIHDDRLMLDNILRLIIVIAYSLKDYYDYPDEFLLQYMMGAWFESDSSVHD